ncbi:hypothetical protein [Streptomyces sp. NPDC048106]|uniref:WD40 repeat domain-containing protein n=1 Tax=Streptomyces sp. NPDC048106 TaxID=3155750 RepID=UPI0034521B02
MHDLQRAVLDDVREDLAGDLLDDDDALAVGADLREERREQFDGGGRGAVLDPLPVTALAFSPDGRTLAVGNPAGRIRLWDLPSRTPLGAPLPTGGDSLRGLAFSPDGRTLYAQGAHTRLRAYPLAPERLATELCARFGSLTRAEWTTYIPDQPYRPTC